MFRECFCMFVLSQFEPIRGDVLCSRESPLAAMGAVLRPVLSFPH